MHGIVSYYTHCIERLLHFHIKAINDERSDIRVNVFAGLPKFLAKLLNAKADQRGSSSRREVKNRARFFVVTTNLGREIRICRWGLTSPWMD